MSTFTCYPPHLKKVSWKQKKSLTLVTKSLKQESLYINRFTFDLKCSFKLFHIYQSAGSQKKGSYRDPFEKTGHSNANFSTSRRVVIGFKRP